MSQLALYLGLTILLGDYETKASSSDTARIAWHDDSHTEEI